MNREDLFRLATEFYTYGGVSEREIAFARVVAKAAAAAEREACLRCYSPDDTATDWADKIKQRGESN